MKTNTNTFSVTAFDLIGYEKFLNILLFNEEFAPQLSAENNYSLGKDTCTRYYYGNDKYETADAIWSMRTFENLLTLIILEDRFKEIRKEIIDSYVGSQAKSIIYEIVESQQNCYDSEGTIIDLTDDDIKFAFCETTIVPIHIKAFLSNHFADIFQVFNPVNAFITVDKYQILLEKFVRHYSLDEVRLNSKIGMHAQVTEKVIAIGGEDQEKLFLEHRKYMIKHRIKK